MRKLSSRWVFIAFGIFLWTVASPRFAYGDIEAPPCSYTKSSENGKYVFVMLAPEGSREFECRGKNDEIRAEAKKFRSKYPHSGLYLSDDERKPLWRVDWYSFEVYVANDGKHVIRMGPWASSGDEEALSLIESGRMTRSYAIKDLVESVSSLPHSTSHFEWKKQGVLSEETGLFSVITHENVKFDFSIKTGDVVGRNPLVGGRTNSENGNSICIAAALAGGIAVLLLRNRN